MWRGCSIMAKGRLPPAPPADPLPASRVEVQPASDVRDKLLALADELDRQSGKPPPARSTTVKGEDSKTFYMASRSGGATRISEDAREAAEAASVHCRAAVASIESGDAAAVAVAMWDLSESLMHTELAGLVKPLLAGLGTMKNSGRKAAHDAQAIEQELDRQQKLHPRWGVTALREAAGKHLNLTERQIRRITKYDPRK